MKTVSIEQIEAALDYLDSLEEDKVQQIMDKLSEKQGLLLSYLLANSESLSEDKSEIFFYIGFVILYIAIEADNDLPVINEKDIEIFELKTTEQFELIEGKDEESVFEFIDAAFNDYRQINLLSFTLEAIFDEDEKGNAYFTDEEISFVLLTLKTIIDCLDK